MIRTSLVVLSALVLSGCGATLGCLRTPPPPGSGVHVASVERDGSVCFRPLELNKPTTEFLSTGIMEEGHLAAPEPGKAWWD